MLVVSTGLDAAVGIALLVWQWRRVDRLQAYHLTRALLGTLALAALEVIFSPLPARTGHPFGALGLLYLTLALAVPLLGAVTLLGGLLWSRTRGSTSRPALAMAAVLFLFAPGAVYGSLIEPYRLQLEQVNVPLAQARAGRAPIRVGVLTDLQTEAIGAHEEEAVSRLMAARPDLILIPGDVYQGNQPRQALAPFRALLGKLQAPGGVYLVRGDCDRRWWLEELVEGTSIVLLDDEERLIELGDRRIRLLGLDLDHWTPSGHQALSRFARAPAGEPDQEIRLAFAHRPGAVLNLEPRADQIDLLIGGHTHGGQVNIPLFGPPITHSPLPRAAAAGGLHVVGGRQVYVSRGVGMERLGAPPLRLFCPPEITLLSLQ